MGERKGYRVAVVVMMMMMIMLHGTEGGFWSDLFSKTSTVTLINEAERGKTMTVHCKGKGGDLGVKKIGYGKAWEFPLTRYWSDWSTSVGRCSFSWGSKRSHSADIGYLAAHIHGMLSPHYIITQYGPCYLTSPKPHCFLWEHV